MSAPSHGLQSSSALPLSKDEKAENLQLVSNRCGTQLQYLEFQHTLFHILPTSAFKDSSKERWVIFEAARDSKSFLIHYFIFN